MRSFRRRRRGHGRHRLDGYRLTQGNDLCLLVDGAQAYPAMLEGIARARRAIALESYIFAPDATGARFRDALAERARAGVSVRVLIDGVGSFGTGDLFFKPLLEAGGQLSVFHPPRPWRPPWRLWRRDHRKLLTVDDREAYLGGINISDDYAPESWGGGSWHDMHLRVRGPAVRELTKVFNRTWRKLTRQHWGRELGQPVPAGDVAVQVLESRLTQRHTVRRALLAAIRRARYTVRITSAYFIPDQGLRRALRNAGSRGVKVQLLLAGRTDLRSVQYASRALYTSLMRRGTEIYEWNDRVLHAKCVVIDGVWCSIGSSNMEHRGVFHNLEANIACIDPKLGRVIEAQFEADLARSLRIDPQSWHRRPVADKMLEQLFFWLRIFL